MADTHLLARVDHLVYATADLERGIEEIEQVLGIRAAIGGRHPDWGTCNALVALGPASYLEIIAPDPEHAVGAGTRPFGLDDRQSSQLVGWAANATRLEDACARARSLGVELGTVRSGSRQPPSGPTLEWELTDLRCRIADGLVPFLIDWGRSPHPSSRAPAGATLVELRAVHPDPQRVRRILQALGLTMQVDADHSAALMAAIECPRGRVMLR